MNRNNGRKIAERLMLLQKYFIENADKTHAVSMEQIRRHYYENGIEGESSELVNIKTVYRDLDALGAYYGLDIEYSEKHKGYLLRNPPFEVYELRLLVDSIQASKFITQREAASLTKKITENFGNGKQHKLNRPAYVYNRIRSQNEDVVKGAGVFYEAIAADRQIAFRYFHLNPDGSKTYSYDGKQTIVSPFALYWQDGNLYLYAYDGKTFRYYRVDRMDRISKYPLEAERDGKDLFREKDLTSQKVKIFKMYSGPEHKVKIRFINRLADTVADEFGRDIMMVPSDSGHFTIEANIQLSPTFYSWVSTFGKGAQILSPAPAVEGMKKFLENASEMYKDDGNT